MVWSYLPPRVWKAAVLALEVVVHEIREAFAAFQVRKRLQAGGPVVVAFLHEPHLVALHEGCLHDRGIVGREDDLGVFRVGLRIAEHGNQILECDWVKSWADLVHDDCVAILQGFDDWPSQLEQLPGAR